MVRGVVLDSHLFLVVLRRLVSHFSTVLLDFGGRLLPAVALEDLPELGLEVVAVLLYLIHGLGWDGTDVEQRGQVGSLAAQAFVHLDVRVFHLFHEIVSLSHDLVGRDCTKQLLRQLHAQLRGTFELHLALVVHQLAFEAKVYLACRDHIDVLVAFIGLLGPILVHGLVVTVRVVG